MISILCVCQGNICRSPALQGCLQKLIDEHKKTEKYYVDSCGLHSFFRGQQMDQRAKKAAEKKGFSISHIAREIEIIDFSTFDYILPVTKEIKQSLYYLAPDEKSKKKIYLATHFSTLYKDRDIEDPYSGGERGFDEMIEILYESATSLFEYLENKPY